MNIKDFSYQYSILKSRAKGNRGKHRSKPVLEFDIEYLKEVWDSQRGICPITGWKLILKTYKNKKDKIRPNFASIDRIDSSLGYIRKNVRFISVLANYALNSNFTDDELIEFVKAAYEYNNISNSSCIRTI